ncbi:hypothetical protein CANTEDRAFT_124965 [Yamadazyma tenuis ATCC 10573]|uniref:Uncharacterized protein n=1 Tax=Candida tenuis (strain ATCC 10573 / BCRC 21748 / CBS 615 / JCM 9827 / NBRC 10315 / NRRL Y-1498 / VKM Y-70) TaxID=590646 RepID=G3B8X5_CANTC|nr:uncharacterized protein CANTEDRAFT_124965 [Yamadazyma tenuis ATCC 10573]EGV61800.1 hypothetical protein CANTEDRAFT_124965 [Yamadazyma tenuis ATCC 10573]
MGFAPKKLFFLPVSLRSNPQISYICKSLQTLKIIALLYLTWTPCATAYRRTGTQICRTSVAPTGPSPSLHQRPCHHPAPAPRRIFPGNQLTETRPGQTTTGNDKC